MKIDKNSTVSNISRLTQISQQFLLTTSGYLVVERKVFLFVDDPWVLYGYFLPGFWIFELPNDIINERLRELIIVH